MNNPNNFISGLMGFVQNSNNILPQMGVPKDIAKTPSGTIQYLMDSGKISQAQYNQAKRIADQMRQNPVFSQLFK